MTQTNTTQNKEELNEKDKFTYWAFYNKEANLTGKQANLVWDYFKDQMAKSNEWWNQKLKQSISQAHQSGIEEERKRILDIALILSDSMGKLDYGKLYRKIESLKENKQ